MREVVLITSMARGTAYGVGTYTNELIYCLQEIGAKVTVVELSMNIPEFKVIEETPRLKKIQFPSSYDMVGNNYFNRIGSLLKLHIQNSSNVVFQFNFHSQKGLMEQVKTKFPQARVLSAVHIFNWGNIPPGNIDMYRLVLGGANKTRSKRHAPLVKYHISEREFFEKVDNIIALSEDTISMLSSAYNLPKEKIFHMPNGMRDSHYKLSYSEKMFLREQFHVGENETILLSVGRLDTNKGIHPLLNCFEKIVRKYKNCRLVLIGDGDTSIFKNHSSIVSKVIFTGKIDHDDVAKWYEIANIGLFPSFSEECSYVGIEMMMHSLPVVASDSYGVRCMFHDGKNSLVAKRESFKSNKAFENNLFENICRMIESKELRDRIAVGSRRTYEQNYGIDIMQRNYKRLLDKLYSES